MFNHLFQVLERAARQAPCKGSKFYDKEHLNEPAIVFYPDLVHRAKSNACALSNVRAGEVVLLHFDRHIHNIIWFWSVLAAGGVPAISPPLTADRVARNRHLNHLRRLLRGPKVLTTTSLLHDFADVDGFDVVDVERLTNLNGLGSSKVKGSNGTNGQVGTVHPGATDQRNLTYDRGREITDHHSDKLANGCHDEEANLAVDLAFLMITSGSTGHAKAVEERHCKVIAALEGKACDFGSTTTDVFLNWIGFDHVACVTEVYLLAVLACADNIHVSSTMVLRDPLLWLKLIEKHSVSHAFAPNFFIGVLNKSIDGAKGANVSSVSSLRTVVSGGEANVVTTGILFNKFMRSMGAPGDVLVPAFGMTETCGGCTYHHHFPILEKRNNLQFCSVGKGTKALEYRITDDEGKVIAPATEGNLELAGPCVFPAYYNDETNTLSSFTSDGWFKTGDRAYIDASGALIVSGRAKDSIIINGVKYFSHELEYALEEARIEGIVPSYTAAFATQPVGSNSEEIVIIFLPTQAALADDDVFASTLDHMSRLALLYCHKKPLEIIPLSQALLPKSALGKLSRPKLRKAYEAGQFARQIEHTRERIVNHRARRRTAPCTEAEKQLIDLFVTEFKLDRDDVGIDDSLLDVSVDSLALIRFKALIQERLKIADVPMTLLLMHPSMRKLASAIEKLGSETAVYNPVVMLQHGDAAVAPMWLFHPGPGEVLVFLGLSQYFSDRMVYGIRAPGFSPHEERFKTLDDMIDTYIKAVRGKQPHGPYVLLGYSFGGILAFEVAKRLEKLGTVQICGILDIPPQVKEYFKEMSWCRLFLSLLSYTGLLTDEQEYEWNQQYRLLPNEEISRLAMAAINQAQLEKLDLEKNKLDLWTDITRSVLSLAHDYCPSGSVECLDVFYAAPGYRISLTKNTKAWFDEDISQWNRFSRNPVRYHASPGTHHTMINAEHVSEFQKLLKAAMKARDVA